MKSRLTIWRLLFAIFVLAVAHCVVTLRDSKESKIIRRSTLLSDSKLIAVELDKANDSSVVITNAGTWRIVKPFSAEVDDAKFAAITDVLQVSQFDDILELSELNKLGRTPEDFGLTTPRLVVKARFENSEKVLNFGNETSTRDGVYANIEGEDYVFVVSMAAYMALSADANDIRRHQLFAMTSEEVSSVDVRDANGAFEKFDRQGVRNDKFNEYLTKLLDAEALDYVWPYGKSGEATTASVSLLSGYGLEPENATLVVLHGVDGVDTSVSFGKPAGEGKVYALVFDGTAIVTVSDTLKAKVEKVETLTDRRLFPLDAREVTSISLTLNGVKYLLEKSKESWRMDAPIVAPADNEFVERVLTRILALDESAETGSGITIALAGGKTSHTVITGMILGAEPIEHLRSREMVNILVPDMKRITSGEVAVTFNAERQLWAFEENTKNGFLDEPTITRLVEELNPLKAKEVYQLKVSDLELGEFGLQQPAFKLAIDLVAAGSSRKNILIGNHAPNGGYYATVGANDAIFIISEEQMRILTAPLIK